MSIIPNDNPRSVRSIPARAGRLFVLISAPLTAAAGFLYIYSFDPTVQKSFFIPCFFQAFTGLYCPGCGNTRALHSLVHLDLIGMLDNNLLFPVTFFILGWLAAGEYLNLLLGRRVLWIPGHVPAAVIAAACVIMAAFAILRNVPFYPFSILAPGV